MSCKFCKGSQRNLDGIKFAPAALFYGIRNRFGFVHERWLFDTFDDWYGKLVEEKKFVLSVKGTFCEFSHCPACGQKFDYMRWIRELWNEFGDVPMDEDEEIEKDWLCFREGTWREEIWHWFEETFNVSVAEDLMYCCMEGLE